MNIPQNTALRESGQTRKPRFASRHIQTAGKATDTFQGWVVGGLGGLATLGYRGFLLGREREREQFHGMALAPCATGKCTVKVTKWLERPQHVSALAAPAEDQNLVPIIQLIDLQYLITPFWGVGWDGHPLWTPRALCSFAYTHTDTHN